MNNISRVADTRNDDVDALTDFVIYEFDRPTAGLDPVAFSVHCVAPTDAVPQLALAA